MKTFNAGDLVRVRSDLISVFAVKTPFGEGEQSRFTCDQVGLVVYSPEAETGVTKVLLPNGICKEFVSAGLVKIQ